MTAGKIGADGDGIHWNGRTADALEVRAPPVASMHFSGCLVEISAQRAVQPGAITDLLGAHVAHPQQVVAIRQLDAPNAQTEPVVTLLQHFVQLLRKRARDELEPWVRAAHRSGAAKLEDFEKRLRREQKAGDVACILAWNQRQITKLMLIRSQMSRRRNRLPSNQI